MGIPTSPFECLVAAGEEQIPPRLGRSSSERHVLWTPSRSAADLVLLDPGDSGLKSPQVRRGLPGARASRTLRAQTRGEARRGPRGILDALGWAGVVGRLGPRVAGSACIFSATAAAVAALPSALPRPPAQDLGTWSRSSPARLARAAAAPARSVRPAGLQRPLRSGSGARRRLESLARRAGEGGVRARRLRPQPPAPRRSSPSRPSPSPAPGQRGGDGGGSSRSSPGCGSRRRRGAPSPVPGRGEGMWGFAGGRLFGIFSAPVLVAVVCCAQR